jgi:hypothetical protein
MASIRTAPGLAAVSALPLAVALFGGVAAAGGGVDAANGSNAANGNAANGNAANGSNAANAGILGSGVAGAGPAAPGVGHVVGCGAPVRRYFGAAAQVFDVMQGRGRIGRVFPCRRTGVLTVPPPLPSI